MKDPAIFFHDSAQDYCVELAEEVLDEILPLVPVLSGRLKNSYKVRKTTDGAEIYTNVPYWDDQEFGTKDQQGTPHVRPGLEAVRSRRAT